MRVALRALTVAVLLFLVLPMLAIVPLSLTASSMMGLPGRGWSLRWYADFFQDPHWLAASRNSLLIGLATAVIATGLGTLAALGLRFGRFRGKGVVVAVLAAPVGVPSVVTGLAMYLAFAPAGLASSFAGIVLAHVVLAAPYSLMAVLAGLRGFDPLLLRAASSLGAPPWAVLWRVLAPLLLPGIATGALFAFAISFDELIITMFLAGPGQPTLPRQMLAGLRDTLTPTLAAAACLLAAVSLGLYALVAAVTRRSAPGAP